MGRGVGPQHRKEETAINVRLTQLDGKMPNIALMRLAAWHRRQGHTVHYRRDIGPDLFEPHYDRVYASVLFSFTEKKLAHFRRQWPGAIIGGTGSGNWDTLETIGVDIPESELDYSDFPEIDYSIGFLQRGCRLKCKFCVVPEKEGRPRFNQTIDQLWRGDPHPRKLHILDNDFFGVPEWKRHIADIRRGHYRVCLSQGINVRLIDDRAAEALASIEYRCTDFRRAGAFIPPGIIWAKNPFSLEALNAWKRREYQPRISWPTC